MNKIISSMKKIEENQYRRFNIIQFNQLMISKIKWYRVTFKDKAKT